MNYVIRALTPDDEAIAWEMLRHAAHESSLASVRSQPELARYVEKWGREGDFGVVAIAEDIPLGAAWVRLWPEDNKGYGYVRDDVPELAIAVLPKYRGRGIGTQLLHRVLEAAQAQFTAVSLSVRANNPAVKLYERIGFVKVPDSDVRNRADGSSYLMICEFSERTQETISIRAATADDVPLILSFVTKKARFDSEIGAFEGSLQVTETKLRETLFSALPFAYVLFAQLEGREIGFALYGFRYSSFIGQPSIWLDDLFVDETMRSLGTGKALMHYLARLSRKHHCTHLAWTADARNTRGLEFYRRLGAEIAEQKRDRYFLKWVPSDLLT
ncbi:MAG: GNAT family N-acetyltransferase [Cyanobacteria bacterium J06642_2]